MQLASALRFQNRRRCIFPSSITSNALRGRFVYPHPKVSKHPLQETLQLGNHKTATHGCFNFGAAIMGSRAAAVTFPDQPPRGRTEENTQNAGGSRGSRTTKLPGLQVEPNSLLE